MALDSLKSAIELGIDKSGLENIREKLTKMRDKDFSEIQNMFQRVKSVYKTNKKLIDKLTMDLCELPEGFFEGTGIDEYNVPYLDFWKIKIGITSYLSDKIKN